MAISSLERTHIIKLVIGLMNIIPDDSCIAKLTTAYEDNGRSLLALAKELASSSEYLALNPPSQSKADFATAVLTPFGLQHNAVARESITAKFDEGVPKGRIVYEWLATLDTSTNAAFRNAKETLHQKAAL